MKKICIFAAKSEMGKGRIGHYQAHMADKRHISESEFFANESRRLDELAGLIALCGRSNGEIARECRLDRRTVSAARRGLAIRSDATERIGYYIRNLSRLSNNETRL